MSATLWGVGVGPGDPDLVTVAALRVLADADVVMVPVADTGEAGRAEATVRAHTDRPLTRLRFALTDAAGRESAWESAGAQVAAAFDGGAASVAFATIGDPNLYSTFSYLAATVRAARPGVAVRTVPGITAMQALAAASGTVLAEGTETLALLPMTAGAAALRAALGAHDTVVAYKGGRQLPEILRLVRAAGRLDGAVLGAALGLPGELVTPAAALPPEEAAPYLSTLLVPPARGGRGARL